MAPRKQPAKPAEPEIVDAKTWAHAATYPLELPGFVWVKVKPVSLGRAMLGGGFPNELLPIAQETAFKGVREDDIEEWEPEKIARYMDLQDWLIAECLQEPKITPEFARDELPADHRPPLLQAALHGRFADEGVAAVGLLAKFLAGEPGALPAGALAPNGKTGQ